MLVHSFDIRSHEIQCETENKGGSAQSDSKIWEVVEYLTGAQNLSLWLFFKEIKISFLSIYVYF